MKHLLQLHWLPLTVNITDTVKFLLTCNTTTVRLPELHCNTLLLYACDGGYVAGENVNGSSALG